MKNQPPYEEHEDETAALRFIITVAAVAAVIAAILLYSFIYDLVRHW